MDKVDIFTDGGARGNPGPAAVGVVVLIGGQKLVIGKSIGKATNNIAEYSAVIEALRLVKENSIVSNINFFLDSELVVRQLNGEYRVRDENLKKLYFEIREFIISYPKTVTFSHIPREKNKEADALVNKALDS